MQHFASHFRTARKPWLLLRTEMIVCSCNAISDAKIKDSVQSEKSPRTPGAVYRCLGCSPNCGRCYAMVQKIIAEALGETDQSALKGADRLARFKEEWAGLHEQGACAAGCQSCPARAVQHED